MLVGMKPDYPRLAKLAKEQDNITTRKQLRAIGFTDKRIAAMVGRKHWVQLQRGVFLLAPGPPTWRQSARAAQWAGGSSVALDAGSSLLWWRLEGPIEGDIELTLTDRKGGPRPRNVVTRQPSRPIRTQERERVQVVCIEGPRAS